MKEKDLREILADLDVQVVHKNHRGWLIARCPLAEYLHERGTDSNPSFNIRIDDRGPSGWHCFSCHQKGRVSALVSKLGYYRDANYRHISLKAEVLEVPETLPDFDELCEEEQHLAKAINPQVYLAMYPLASEHEESKSYLMRRGVSRAACDILSLRYDPERQRILFPVFDYKNDLYGFTGRLIHDSKALDLPKVRNYAGLRKEFRLLGEHLIEPGKPILVVEGLFALAHMMSIGAREICNPVAIMGSDMSTAQRDLLLAHDEAVYLLFDDDAAGTQGLFGVYDKREQRHLGGGAIDLLKQHTTTAVCYYPERTGDPDDITFEELQRMIDTDHEIY